jgi:exopolysaccharide biosynthesis operon protein EpsL
LRTRSQTPRSAFGSCTQGTGSSGDRRGSTLRRALSLAAVVAGALAPLQEASALLGDRLELFASERLIWDDNVFRLPSGVDPATRIGSSERGDFAHTTSLGFNLDVPVSRQRFQAGYSWNQTKFNRFTDLDFTGHDGRAIWLWQLGNQLSGQVGYTETMALASFANIQNRVANPLKTQQTFANGTYMLTPRWRLRAGVTELEQTNRNSARAVNDINTQATEGSVSYVTPLDNSLGLVVRTEDGHYPNRQVVGATPLDNSYTQDGIGVLGEWNVTGQSRLTARLDRVKREYGQLAQRNFSGTTYRAVYDWRPTGRFALLTTLMRDISPLEDIRTSFVLVKGISFAPSYVWTDKVSLSGNLDFLRREYLGDATFSGREEKVRVAGVTVSYRPTRTVTLLASLLRESRDSNLALADYTANVFTLTGRIGF